ncbi:MAG TPA: hypothetical protein DCY85_12600 [Firmicutes bacterium]|nr:hypothetical protein [Bacillota bacterium]
MLIVSAPIFAGAYLVNDQEQLFALFPVLRTYLILPVAITAFGLLITVAFLRGMLKHGTPSGQKEREEME